VNQPASKCRIVAQSFTYLGAIEAAYFQVGRFEHAKMSRLACKRNRFGGFGLFTMGKTPSW